MTAGPETTDLWDLTLTALCRPIGSADQEPAVTAGIAALLGLQQIKARLTAAAEGVGTPIGENRFGPLVESAIRLVDELTGHIDGLGIVAADLAAAESAGGPAVQALQAGIEMPLNAVQTCVEALALARRAMAMAGADAGPAIVCGAELLAASARTMLHLVGPLIERLPADALAADYRQSIEHFGPVIAGRTREIEGLARRRRP